MLMTDLRARYSSVARYRLRCLPTGPAGVITEGQVIKETLFESMVDQIGLSYLLLLL